MPSSERDTLALRWVPGAGPVQVQPLTTGLVNESWRVTRDGHQYVMRVAAGTSSDLGQDREWECKVLASAAAAGLAPLIERCDVPRGLLISNWVECRAWTAEETEYPDNVRTMAQLLRRVHALPVPQPARAMNPAAWIGHYAAALSRHEPEVLRLSQGLRLSADVHLAQLAGTAQAGPVLCHSDLHRFNVAVGLNLPAPTLLLLDWEYAHAADPYWDLAGWAANNDWSVPAASCWLESYLGHEPLPEEGLRLRLWMWLYDYVCLLWSELYSSRAPGPAAAEMEERVETLGARLASGAHSRAR